MLFCKAHHFGVRPNWAQNIFAVWSVAVHHSSTIKAVKSHHQKKRVSGQGCPLIILSIGAGHITGLRGQQFKFWVMMALSSVHVASSVIYNRGVEKPSLHMRYETSNRKPHHKLVGSTKAVKNMINILQPLWFTMELFHIYRYLKIFCFEFSTTGFYYTTVNSIYTHTSVRSLFKTCINN